MNNAMQFLVTTLIELYSIVVILRLWMQAVRADYYNPLSQFVVKATEPLLGPLRKVIPSKGRIDLACLILAIALGMLKIGALVWLNDIPVNPLVIVVQGLLSTVSAFLTTLFWILIIRALLSWFSQGYNPMEAMLYQLTEPFLAPVRRIIPPLGGLDLSVLIVIIAIQFLRILIGV